jgi:DNA-directed RNA polymerase specialized sigma subunit
MRKKPKDYYTHEDCFNIASSIYGEILSLDQPVNDEDNEEVTLKDVMGSSRTETFGTQMFLVKLKLFLMEFAETRREEQVIELLAKGLSKGEIAEKFKISQQRVGQIVQRFVKRIPDDARRMFLSYGYRKGVL